MDWSTFLAQIRRDIEEPVAGVWSDDSLLFHANEGIKDIAVRTKASRDWVYTNTVADQYIYDLPDHSLEVIDLYYDNKKLLRMDFADWYKLPTESGTPVYYAIDDANIYLYPIPDAVAEMSYLRYTTPTPLADEADSMPFEDRYDSAIAYYVKSLAFEQVSDWESANAMRQRYEAEISKAASQESIERQAGRSVAPREVW